MRLLSTTALSIALATTSIGLILPSAAIAAKKEKAEEASAGVKLAPSKEFVPGAQEVQKLLAANDFAGAQAKLAAVEGTATKPDDNYYVGNFYLNIGLGLKDEAMQRKGLEKMIASGMTKPEELGKFEFATGQLALNAKDFAGARAHLANASKANYGGANTEVYMAESYFGEAYGNVSGSQFNPAGKALVQQGLPHLRKAIELQQASGTAADPSWYTRGLKMSVLANDPTQIDWFKLALPRVGSTENWRVALRAVQDENDKMTPGESLDLLRLMAASKSLQNAFSYNEYAETAWKAGLPGEVKSVIDTGRASGEIQASSLTDLYKLAADSVGKDKASLPASEKSAAAAATGKPAASTANAFMSYGDYAKAADLYRLALQKGGVDADEVNTRLGIALARTGDKTGAVGAFGKVSGTGVRKKIADLWTVWVNSPAA
jgi:hypothetical protein